MTRRLIEKDHADSLIMISAQLKYSEIVFMIQIQYSA